MRDARSAKQNGGTRRVRRAARRSRTDRHTDGEPMTSHDDIRIELLGIGLLERRIFTFLDIGYRA